LVIDVIAIGHRYPSDGAKYRLLTDQQYCEKVPPPVRRSHARAVLTEGGYHAFEEAARALK
jgi:hypothetical protein